jgi:hypothetical protein
MTDVELPKHISFSSANDFLRCRRSWYLGKIRKAEQKQTWFLPIGTAVHQMVEDHLDLKPLGAGPDGRKVEDYFYPLISAQLLIEPDMSKWLSGGPKADPTIGDKALQKVKDCYEKALEFLDDWDVWEVEYDASGRLPGLEVEVKAFVDIIGEYKGKKNKKAHGPGALDWKTGKSKPKTPFQLETYTALSKEGGYLNGIKPLKFHGWWAMLDPNASEARPIDLSEVDPSAIGARYQEVWDGMKSMQIQAIEDRSKFTCGFCFQSPNCAAWNEIPTKRSKYYDLSKQHQPPF